MGKTKKARSRQGPLNKGRPDLGDDIESSKQEPIKASKATKNRIKLKGENTGQEDYVNSDLTKKILAAAVKQQEELENDIGLTAATKSVKHVKISLGKNAESDDEDDWPALGAHVDESAEKEIVINEEDEASLATFMNPNPPTRRTLADIIMDKITEKQTDVSTMMPDLERPMPDLDPKIIEVYKDVKTILQKYRSGKLPKAFKVMPNLRNWEEILYITDPETWSAAAVFQATRIFASNLNESMAQRFFNLVLLPRVRDDIHYYKRLNFHLFMSMKKALFKPAAFFKGILLPLCEEGTCTLREATIIGSVISKCSIPVLHASAALIKISEMHYNGANSIFLRLLISKKYALPFRVIDALVFHFLQFRNDKRTMPVLWHQSFLAFAEIYRNDISDEQAEGLLELLKYQSHEKITSEIRYQLQTRTSKEVVMEEPM